MLQMAINEMLKPGKPVVIRHCSRNTISNICHEIDPVSGLAYATEVILKSDPYKQATAERAPAAVVESQPPEAL